MPEGMISVEAHASERELQLDKLEKGRPDSLGIRVREILFRGRDYAIYRSDRGVYVHFSDDPGLQQAQRSAYAKLCVQICELRYLTSQMRSGVLRRIFGLFVRQRSLYDHNMAQAFMLLMESVAQRMGGQTVEAAGIEQKAKEIAQRALDMAVRRKTVDNTIRYVRTCVLFGIAWVIALILAFYQVPGIPFEAWCYLLASATGIVGAVFSVIVRAQAFELKPCDDSGMNKLMSLIRIGMGGIAGPALFLLLMTVSANAMAGNSGMTLLPSAGAGFVRMVAIIGLIGGFAERLVPDLVRGAADKIGNRAGTPGQAMQTTSASPELPKAADRTSDQGAGL
jgi:hypothetical protein